MRKLLVLLVFLAMTGVSSYAQQDETPADRRSMTMYSCINSGDLTDKISADGDASSRLFSGNCFVYGVTYNHVFASIPWMTLHSRVNFKGSQGHLRSGEDYFGLVTGDYASEVRGRFGLGFRIAPGLSASANIDSRGILYESLDYSYSFGRAGSIAIGQELCARAIPIAVTTTNTTTTTTQVPTYDKDGIEDGYYETTSNSYALSSDGYKLIDMLGFNIAYSVPLADGLSFRSRLRLQLAGAFEREDTNVEDVFRIRWENRLSYNVSPKVNLWGTVRYQAGNLTHSEPEKNPVDHRVFLMAGFTYSFNASGL